MAKSRKAQAGLPRAAIYTRVSSVGQEDNTSLETQEAACRALAVQKGYEVVGTYQDVHTGEDLIERPRLGDLLQEIRSGTYDVVLAHAPDRLSRKVAHRYYLTVEAQSVGTRVEYVLSGYDTSTLEGSMLDSITGILAEFELLKIKERTSRGKLARAQGGVNRPAALLPGAHPLYGYQWRDETKSAFDINPITAPIVRRIFDSMLSGATLRGITKSLTADAVPTPSGKTVVWSIATVANMLRQPSYAGVATAYLRTSEKVPGKQARKRIMRAPGDEGVVMLPDGTIPAIVTLEEFQAVGDKLHRNKAQAVRNNPNPQATLLRGGFAKCGYCGCNLRAMKASRNQGYVYRCAGNNSDRHGCPFFSIAAPTLDAAVWERVLHTVTHPDIMRERLAAMAEPGKDTGGAGGASRASELEKALTDNRRQRDKLIGRLAMLDDEADAQVVSDTINQLAIRSRVLETELSEVTKVVAEIKGLEELFMEFDSWAWTWGQQLATCDYASRRYLLEALGVQVRVWSMDHEPRYDITARVPLDLPHTLSMPGGVTHDTAGAGSGVVMGYGDVVSGSSHVRAGQRHLRPADPLHAGSVESRRFGDERDRDAVPGSAGADQPARVRCRADRHHPEHDWQPGHHVSLRLDLSGGVQRGQVLQSGLRQTRRSAARGTRCRETAGSAHPAIQHPRQGYPDGASGLRQGGRCEQPACSQLFSNRVFLQLVPCVGMGGAIRQAIARQA